MAGILRPLLVLAILFVAAGVWLSWLGYSEASRLAYTTYTRLSTGTSTRIVMSTWIETFTSTRIGRTLVQETFELDDYRASCASTYVENLMMTVWYGSVDVWLEAGEVHVSYKSDANVNFWMLTSQQWSTWNEQRCEALFRLPAVVARGPARSNHFAVNLPSGGRYYFTFDSWTSTPASVTLSVEGPSREEFTTVGYHTTHATEQELYATSSTTVVSEIAGLGATYYSGIGLAAAGVLLTLIGRAKRVGADKPRPAKTPSQDRSRKEVEVLLARLEDLHSRGQIGDEVYSGLKAEYERKLASFS